MKRKGTADIAIWISGNLLLGLLFTTFVCGVIALPSLLTKTDAGSRYVLIAVWLTGIAILLMANVTVKKIADMHITQRAMEISVFALQRELDKTKNQQMSEQLREEHTKPGEDDAEHNVVVYGLAGSFTGKSGS